MSKKRGLAVFAVAFVVVLIGGVAMAGVGVFAPAGDPSPRDAMQLAAGESSAASGQAGTSVDEPAEGEPGDRPDGDRPGDPPGDQPGDEPGDDAVGPRIEILRPEHGAHVEAKVIIVAGRVELPARVTVGDRIAAVDDDGHWLARVELVPGRNRIVAVAIDREGNTNRDHIVVFYDQTQGFTAHQQLAVVDGENPVVNFYWGTGRPGAEVHVGSEYGRGATKVGDDGMWELRVQFEAPCNQVFRVAAESGDARVGFEMKRACREEHQFTAHQKYEVVDGENPVVNFYWGTGRPGAEVHVGSEYGRGATTVDEFGRWELRVQFEAPCNQVFRVAAESGDARVGFEMKRACREEHQFTAHQTFGSCGEAIPYDVFYGTGTPGAAVFVESPFGSGKTTVGEGGEWRIEVEFPEAPRNEDFEVVIESDGGRAVFTFVATGGGDHG